MCKVWAPVDERVLANISPEPNSGCWLWSGYTTASGYGQIRGGGTDTLAHRRVFEKYRGPVPVGMELDHLCRVRCCVNPDHLEVVTPKENTRRGITVALREIKDHCPAGHEFTPENTYGKVSPYGTGTVYRTCKKCSNDRSRRRYLASR